MTSKNIPLELLPEEREVLLKWILIPEVCSQLEAIGSSEHVETIQATPTDINWLAGDLNHAIVKKGCRDQAAIELAERLEFIEASRDGRLDSWYWQVGAEGQSSPRSISIIWKIVSAPLS